MHKHQLSAGVAMAGILFASASAYALGLADSAPQRINLKLPLSTNKVSVEKLVTFKADTEVPISTNKMNLRLSLSANRQTVDRLSSNKVSVETLRSVRASMQQ